MKSSESLKKPNQKKPKKKTEKNQQKSQKTPLTVRLAHKGSKGISKQHCVSRSNGSFMLLKSEKGHQGLFLTVNVVQDSVVCKLEGQETQVQSLWSLPN